MLCPDLKLYLNATYIGVVCLAEATSHKVPDSQLSGIASGMELSILTHHAFTPTLT